MADYQNMSVDEWLFLVESEPGEHVIVRFPTDKMRDEYLDTIGQRDEAEILELLSRFLVHQGATPKDQFSYIGLCHLEKESPEAFLKALDNQYVRRLLAHFRDDEHISPMEGNTWILDLLPHRPKEALEGLNAYLIAHITHLSDGRLWGFADASRIIRAKFIGKPETHSETIAFLRTLHWRQFECLTEQLYHSMGYDTELTPPQKDGGRDVVARRHSPGSRETVLVDCKLWNSPIPVEEVRKILGTMSDAKANKGVLVTVDDFTDDARELASRNPVELIGGAELVPLLNEHLGGRWSLNIEWLLLEAEKPGVHTHPE